MLGREFIKLFPQGRISDRIGEQIADVSVPKARVPAVQTAQRTVGVMKVVPQEHVQQRTVECAHAEDDLDAGAGNQRSTQQPHRSKQQGNQQQSTRQETQEKTEERVEEERRRKVERRKGKEQEEEEKERKEAEEGRDKEVKEDVMGWTAVTRNRKEKRRMVQIFVKVNESEAFPLDK